MMVETMFKVNQVVKHECLGECIIFKIDHIKIKIDNKQQVSVLYYAEEGHFYSTQELKLVRD